MNDVNAKFISDAVKKAQALLVDCDGVLYNRAQCTDRTIQTGLLKTLDMYHIPHDEFHQARAELKTHKVRGLFNAVLKLCRQYDIPFNDFTNAMVGNIDYSQISPDPEMLKCLRATANVIPVYIATNNSAPHLRKIFDCLRGKPSIQTIQEELHIHPITIENTLSYNQELGQDIFHPKQMKNQFINLCASIGYPPSQVALIDDTERIYTKAQEQGLLPLPTDGPTTTKETLKAICKTAAFRMTVHGKNNQPVR